MLHRKMPRYTVGPGCWGPIMGWFRSVDVRKLLHNKFVVVLGDSIQRSVYKDLVKLLQDDRFLSEDQLRDKGEETFENDALVEGGARNGLHNGTTFREVRQYRSGHHLVRFYFLTRVYSTYLESVLSDFRSGPQPDVVIANSCIWDVNRYNDKHLEAYKTNLDFLFQRLKEVLSPQCLIIWNMTMPVGFKDSEIPENTRLNLRRDIVEGNFFSCTLAALHKLDVLDMHYHFRCDLRLRCPDAVHWNQVAHRKYTQILLTHIARAWGVRAPKGKKLKCSPFHAAPPNLVASREHIDPNLLPPIQERELCSQGKIPLLPTMGSPFTGQRMMFPGGTLWGQQHGLPAPVNAEAAYIPRHPSFEGSDINAMPGPPVHVAPPDSVELTEDPYPWINPPFQEHWSQGPSPFVTSSPPLSPGYFTHPPGPAFPSHPFTGGNFFPPNMPLSPINFPLHDPYSQEDLYMKIMSRRMLNPRQGWTHPYPRPPAFLPGIY